MIKLTSRQTQQNVTLLFELMHFLRDPEAQLRLEELRQLINEIRERQTQAEARERANSAKEKDLTALEVELGGRVKDLAAAESRHKEETDALATASISLETQRRDHEARVKHAEPKLKALADRERQVNEGATALDEREQRVAQRERDYQEPHGSLADDMGVGFHPMTLK